MFSTVFQYFHFEFWQLLPWKSHNMLLFSIFQNLFQTRFFIIIVRSISKNIQVKLIIWCRKFFSFDFLKYLYCVVFFEIFVKITYYGFLFSGGSPQTKAISIQSKWGCILGGDLLKQQKWSLFRFRYESRCNGIEHNLYICSPCGPCFGNYYWKMDFLNNNITSFYVKSLSADNQKIQMI